jgi:predicted Rossmann fold flavoprotein
MKQFDAIIIGAGPAGIMAAIRAAEKNRHVLIVEQNNHPAKKLLISGGGRCNLTNSGNIDDFLGKFSESRDFLRNTFSRFFNTELISLLENSDLRLKTEQDGRVFPKSDRASDVLNALKSKLTNKYATFIFGERVREIIINNNKIEGVMTYSNKSFPATRVVIATGGLTYPETGSTGDGYAIAKKLGHKIITLKPALIPVIIKEKFIKDWQGISFNNIGLTLLANDKKINEKYGEIIFTHFGLSGPAILDISATAYDALKIKNKVQISINFMPNLDRAKLDSELLRSFRINPKKSIKNIFKSFLPQGIINRFMEHCGVREDKNASQITANDRNRLINGLSAFKLTVQDTMPIKNGIITRGGINTKEINPKTMESKLIKGLFFAGEAIDMDAKTGGYNMQAAFSTGWICGDNI